MTRIIGNVEKAIVDGTGLWLHNATTYLDTETTVDTLPPTDGSLARPKWDGAAWIEGADAPTLAIDLAAVKTGLKQRINDDSQAHFEALCGGNWYVKYAHNLKLFEANRKESDDHGKDEHPKHKRDDPEFSGDATPILTAEAAARSMSVSNLADEIRSANATEWVSRVSSIEAVRVSAREDVDAAATRAAANAVYDQFVLDLAAIT